jgi:hypothetical protein
MIKPVVKTTGFIIKSKEQRAKQKAQSLYSLRE